MCDRKCPVKYFRPISARKDLKRGHWSFDPQLCIMGPGLQCECQWQIRAIVRWMQEERKYTLFVKPKCHRLMPCTWFYELRNNHWTCYEHILYMKRYQWPCVAPKLEGHSFNVVATVDLSYIAPVPAVMSEIMDMELSAYSSSQPTAICFFSLKKTPEIIMISWKNCFFNFNIDLTGIFILTLV